MDGGDGGALREDFGGGEHALGKLGECFADCRREIMRGVEQPM